MFTVEQKFYRWRNDVSGKVRGGKVKRLGMKVRHNASGKCQMVRLIDRIHRTSMFTVGQKFYRWRNDVIGKLRGGKVKSLGMKRLDRSIGSIGQACLRSDRNFTDGEMTSLQSYAVAK